MALLSNSPSAECPRLDDAGVSWPRLPLREAVRLDWARVRRFRIAKQVASWEYGRGGKHARSVPSWDLARACRRSGRRVVLLWAPLLGVAAAVHQGTVAAPQPAPWLFGLLAGLGPAAFGAAYWWLGHRGRGYWDELGRRADELLARLGW